MSNILNYSKFNESIRNLLVGPTEEEVHDLIRNLNPDDMLVKSCRIGYLNGVKLAIENGVDVNIVNINGNIYKPILIASRYCDFVIFDYLVKHGADIHVDSDKPLRFACFYGHYDIVKSLLYDGCNPNGVSNSDSCPLWGAVKNKHYKIIDLLLSYGINDKNINDCIKTAKSMRYDDIVDLLTKYLDE